MANKTDIVKIILSVDPKRGLAGFKKFQTGVKNGVSKMRANFQKLRGSMSCVIGTIGGVVGIYGMIRGFKVLTAASENQNDADKRLIQTLKSTENAAGLTFAELKNMASGLQNVTRFGDEVVQGAQGLLLTFTNIGKDVFPQATRTILDMASAMAASSGGEPDLKSASIQIGKALNDPIKGVTALSKVGVSFTEQQKLMIKTLVETGETAKAQKIILAELNKEFGGQASIEGYRTNIAQLNNAFGDLIETWGNFITRSETGAGVIKWLTGFIKGLTFDVKNMGTNFEIFNIKVAKVFNDIANKAKQAWNKVFHPIRVDELNARLENMRIAFNQTADRMISDLENKKFGFLPEGPDIKAEGAGTSPIVEKSKEELAQIAEINKLRIQNTLEGLEEEIALVNLSYDDRVKAAEENNDLIVELNIARAQEIKAIEEKFTKVALDEADKLKKFEADQLQERKDAETELYLFKVETGRITLEDHISNLEKSLVAEKLTAIKRLQIEDELTAARKEIRDKENEERIAKEQAVLTTLRQGYDVYWQALTDGQANTQERIQAIQLGLERMIISSIGNQLKAYLFSEVTKEGVSKATTASILTDNTVQFLSGLKTSGADILGAVAKAIKAVAGIPFAGVALGAAAGAGIMALFQGFKGNLGFQGGGHTGQGSDNEIAGVVHRNEFVIPANVMRSMGQGGSRSTIVFNPQIQTFTPTETRRLIRDELYPQFKEIVKNGKTA